MGQDQLHTDSHRRRADVWLFHLPPTLHLVINWPYVYTLTKE